MMAPSEWKLSVFAVVTALVTGVWSGGSPCSPQLIVTCAIFHEVSSTEIQCLRSNNIVSTLCTIDGMDEQPCAVPLIFHINDWQQGAHHVQITFTDECGQNATKHFSFFLTSSNPDNCNEGDIQVYGYPFQHHTTYTPQRGLVKVCSRGQWGSVCNNGWDDNDATVVCRQVGSDRGIVTYSLRFRSGPDFNSMLLFNVECVGTENELFQCPQGEIKNITCLYVVAVICSSNISVQLSSELYFTTETKGYVEICADATYTRTGAPQPFTLSVDIGYSDGISSNDIVQEIEETFIEFNNNDQHKCKNITIFNDDICESNISLALSTSTNHYSDPESHGEAFSIELSVKSGENIVIGHNMAHIWIEEGAEPECRAVIGFTQSTYTASEENEFFEELCIQAIAVPVKNQRVEIPFLAEYSPFFLYILRPIILEEGKKYCSNITTPKSSDCSVASGNISIFNASIDIETFQEPYVELQISEASVFIDDQNETECGPITVGFNTTNITTSETIGLVKICAVIISGVYLRRFSLSVLTHISTTDGTDFDGFVNQVISFETADTEKCFNITVINDEICEWDCDREEHFILMLESEAYRVEVVDELIDIIIQDEYEDECKNLNCNDPEETAGSSSSDTGIIVWVAVPAVLVIVLLLFLIILGLIIFLWKKKKKFRTTWEIDNDVIDMDNLFNDNIRPPSIDTLKEILPQSMIISAGNIRIRNIVGQGESGLVYKAYLKSGGNTEVVAVKTGKALFTNIDSKKLMKEVTTMMTFDHPNVMSLVGICIDRDIPLIIMPFMSNGSVLDSVRTNRRELHFESEGSTIQISSAKAKLLGICHQIAKGMCYLTEQQFIHRDLAARNCMIDMHGVIKVADFGLTEDLCGSNYYRPKKSETGNERMPIRWMAPESIEKSIYNEKTDVWSFGVTCWEVFTCGGVPFSGISVMSLLANLRSGERLERPLNAACSDEIYTILLKCWVQDPDQRPVFSELAHQLSCILEQDAGYLQLS